MAYNPGNLWRRLVLPKRIEKWSGRLIKRARYYWLLLAESGLTRRPFGAMVRRLAVLQVATG